MYAEKAKETVKKLTAAQKLRLLCGKDCWHTVDFDGLLPAVTMSDGPVGLRTERIGDGGKQETIPAIGYPSVQVLANTWNTSLAQSMGECLADDCIDRGVDLLLAPGVNIKRHPLNGRNFEYFSEDPYLAGTMAKAYIEGVQKKGVGACVKHFCCNNLEYDRLHQSSEVDERTLREIYYRPFAIACEAHPVSVMCSYNRINGVYGSEYKKGYDMLRGDCGFDGAVISDWCAVRDRTASAKAGLDLEMPFNQKNYEKLASDYEQGKLTDQELDRCAERVLEMIFRLDGMRKQRKSVSSESVRKKAANRVAAEGVVLLKNDGALPLAKGTSASVCGFYAKPGNTDFLAGGGSSQVNWSNRAFDIPAALEECGVKTVFEPAFGIDTIWSMSQDTAAAPENAALCDANIVCVGTGNCVEYEEGDRKTTRLPDVQERAILETAERNKNTVVIVFAGAAIDMSAWADRVNAIVYAGFCGMESDRVLAGILTGKINPSGKLSETFPLSLEDVPAANAPRRAGYTRYLEELDVGYRYFDTYEVPVLFPFGHGLSYSEFRYGDLHVQTDGNKLAVRFTVKNVSARAGAEIAQVYVCPCALHVYRPKKELKAYAKREIAAGKTQGFEFVLTKNDFCYWSAALDKFTAEDGVYEIAVGASVADIRLRAKVRLRGGLFEVL